MTRFSLVQVPPKSLRGDHQGEQFADEGTLILAPADYEHAPISVPPSSFIPPPPPSSIRPMVHTIPPSSVRPSMPSWDDRVWSLPAGERTGTTAITDAKKKMSARERSASAMLAIATAAMLAAFASIGFMRRADRQAAAAAAATAEVAPVAVTMPEPVAAPIAAPIAPPVAPPVAPAVAPPVAIDMDDVKPAAPAVAPAPIPKPAAVAPTTATTTTTTIPATTAPKPAAREGKEPKEKAPASSTQKKALADLLEQLGEEQLKR